MFGGSMGEVFRKHHGGDWAMVQVPGAPGPQLAVQRGEGKAFFPSKVYQRLVNGDEDNVWVFYQVLVKDYMREP